MEILIYNLLLAFVIMGGFYLVYLNKQDPSIVDVAFTLSLVFISLLNYWHLEKKTAASHLFLLMTMLWGLRLFLLLLFRYWKGQRDLRYDLLKKTFSIEQKKKFFLFFLFQAIAVFFLSVSFVIAYQYQTNLERFQWLAFSCFVLFFSLELLADYQMFMYRLQHHGKPGVCQEGLWRYSRHPNYFFEVLIWYCFALFASSTGYAVFSWMSAALLTYFILYVTGIPVTEALLIQTKGEAYKEYQRKTSKFFPKWPKP